MFNWLKTLFAGSELRELARYKEAIDLVLLHFKYVPVVVPAIEYIDEVGRGKAGLSEIILAKCTSDNNAALLKDFLIKEGRAIEQGVVRKVESEMGVLTLVPEPYLSTLHALRRAERVYDLPDDLVHQMCSIGIVRYETNLGIIITEFGRFIVDNTEPPKRQV